MEFKKYQHIERFGTPGVQNIEFGECYIFPKIDGTNASVWAERKDKYLFEMCAGSRNRKLTEDEDNVGFFKYVNSTFKYLSFLNERSDLRLFGEWLVPHSLKTYKDNTWKKFYVFDVMDENGKYLHYNEYKPLLEKYRIDYIPPLAIITNPTYGQLIKKLPSNNYLIKDGEGAGEGVVIKNYNFINKFGKTIWAKIVTSEFKEKHSKTMGAPESKGKKMIEEEIAKEYTTKALCEKVYAKIKNESGWESKFIPRLLNTVYYDIVNEESWVFIKKYKNPVIDFKRLQYLVFAEIKIKIPAIFKK
jgi:hypothetical protein